MITMGIGDWGLGPIPIPNPQSPIPNPPIPNPHLKYFNSMFLTFIFYLILNSKKTQNITIILDIIYKEIFKINFTFIIIIITNHYSICK